MPSVENTSLEQKFLETKALQNEAASIHQLPIETLIEIISLSGPDPSNYTPYPYIPFSGVCRHWRSIILCNATFWTTIVFDEHITLTFLQVLLERSQTALLELIVVGLNLSFNEIKNGLEFLSKESANRNRVNTISIVNRTYSLHKLYISNVVSLFPFAENIFFFAGTGSYDPSLPSLGVQPQLKTLRIPIARLGCLDIPGQFPRLRWLQLKYDNSIPFPSLLNALKNLPNLQVLYLHSAEWIGSIAPRVPDRTITLHELRCLITEGSIPRFIRAPKLTYLKVENYPRNHGDVPFCGFDFSGITEIIFDLDHSGTFSITGCHRQKDSKATFSLYRGQLKPILDPIPESYPNTFRIALEDAISQDPTSAGPRTFLPFLAACANQTTNLTAVTFSCQYRLRRRWTQVELNAIFTKLKGATLVRRLSVAGGCSLPTLCDLLSDSTIFPNLTNIAYCNVEESQNSSDLYSFRSLQRLIKGRSGTSPRPLQIDLEDFPPIQSESIERLENLEIRVIQSNRYQCIITVTEGTEETII